MLIQIVLVFKDFGAILAHVVGGLRVNENHMTLHAPFGFGYFSTQCAFVVERIATSGATFSSDTDKKLHKVLFQHV